MTSESVPSILLVDDEEMIRTLLRRTLLDKKYVVVTAGSRKEAIEKVNEKQFDLLIVDKNLPDGSGFDVIDAAKRRGHRSESIVITAYSDTDSAIQAVALGVFRYVRKPFDLKVLGTDIASALETHRLRRDLGRRTEEVEQSNRALATSEERFRLLFNSGNDAVFVYPLSSDGISDKFIEVNDVACRWLGYTRRELLHLSVGDLYSPKSLEGLPARTSRLLANKYFLSELELVSRDGRHIAAEVSARLFEFEDRLAVLAIARDITERRRSEKERARLEEQFRESQKMEAIGRLAGGVAHDMNNVLGAVMGLAAAFDSEDNLSQRQREDLASILEACRRGRDLTRDLLGFARKGKYRKEKINLNRLAKEIKQILTRTIPRTVEIETTLEQDLELTVGDSGQITHAAMNVCINAVDAMRGRGKLHLRTRNVVIDTEEARKHNGVTAGKFAMLEIIDTGSGMDATTLDLAFEPFFTTKPQGKGSGLGLAMVYGTIKNHSGLVKLSSEVGKGTEVKICLPAVDNESTLSQSAQRGSMRPVSQTQTGKVLLVDDEPMIRNAGRRLLERLGYEVILAATGEDAVEMYKGSKDDIWLVVLDLIMPGMDGEDVFMALKEFDPGVTVLLSSGYSKEEKAEELLEQGAAAFIQKPFDLNALADQLARLHDRRRRT